MPFQLNTTKLFFTYPECPLTKEDARLQLEDKLRDFTIDQYVIATELHENGHQHLHCYFQLASKIRTKDARLFDLYDLNPLPIRTCYHGNYQPARSRKNVLKYCTKEGNYISNIDVHLLLGGKSSRRVVAEELISKKKELKDLVVDHPCLIYGYRNLKSDLLTWQDDISGPAPDLPINLPNPWGKVLPSNIKGKRRHFWIFSRKPNLGKTYNFAIPLRDTFGAKIFAGDITYFSISRGDRLLIFDDYNRAKFKYDDLNTMCDGTYYFRRMYAPSITVDNYMIVVLSNQSIKDIYPYMNELLYERFNEIEL